MKIYNLLNLIYKLPLGRVVIITENCLDDEIKFYWTPIWPPSAFKIIINHENKIYVQEIIYQNNIINVDDKNLKRTRIALLIESYFLYILHKNKEKQECFRKLLNKHWGYPLDSR